MDNPNAIAEAKSLVYALNERKKYWESVKNVPTARAAQAEEERKRKEAENSLPPLPENVTIGEDGSLQAVDNNEEKEEEPTKMSRKDATALIEEMEEHAVVAPEMELTIGNWDKLFGSDGRVNTPVGIVKMGENQFAKLMRQGRNSKLGMVKPTLENPYVIIEVESEAKEGTETERKSSYIFVRAFVKTDGTRYYYFTSVTVSKNGHEVIVSNQEKSRNRLLRLLTEGDVIWRTPNDAAVPSAEKQGLDYVQPTETETATKGSGITPQSISSASEDTTSEEEMQESAQENADKTQEIDAASTAQQAEEQNREERKQMLENMSIEELEKEIERIRNFNHPIFTMTEEEKAKEIAELQSIIDRKTQTSAQQAEAEEATPQAEEQQTANEDEQRDAVNKQVEKVLSEHGYHKGDMFRTHNMGNNAKAEIAGFDAGGVVLRTFAENGKQTAQYIELAENFLEMVDNGYLEPITEERKESEEKTQDKTKQNDSEGKQEEKKPQKPTSNRKNTEEQKERLYENGGIYIERETTEDDGAYEVYSLHNGDVVQYCVPDSADKRIADFKKPGEESVGTAYNAMGDYMFRSLEEAKEIAEKLRVRDAANAEYQKKVAEKEKAEAEKAEAEKERKRYGGFTDGKSPMQAANIAKVLDKLHNYTGYGTKAMYKHIEDWAKTDGVTFGVEHVPGKKTPEYYARMKDGSEFLIPKTAYDYAKFVGGKMMDEADIERSKKDAELQSLKQTYSKYKGKAERAERIARLEKWVKGVNDKELAKELADLRRLDELMGETEKAEKPQQEKAEGKKEDAASEPTAEEGKGKKPSSARGKKIEDVGEKIGGARKDIASEMSGKINLNADTFPKMFPKFDLKKLVEKGLDPKMAAAVMFLRQEAMKVFKSKKKRSGTAEALSAAKFFAAYAKRALEEGNTDVTFTDGRWMFTEYGQASIKTNIELYGKIMEKMGTDMLDLDLSDYHIDPIGVGKISGVRHYAYRNDGKGGREQFEPHYTAHAGRSVDYLKEDERDKAFEFVINKLEQNVSYKNAHPYSLSVYRQGSKYFVGTRISGEIEHLTEDFDNLKDANEYLNANEADLQVKAAQTEQQKKADKKSTAPVAKVEMRYTDNYRKATINVKIGNEYVSLVDEMSLNDAMKYYKEHREELQQKAQQLMDEWFEAKQKAKGWKPELSLGGVGARSGEDYRHGRDIDAEELHNTFGFRGIEFGNYVSQKERQKFLNETYDALMDLSTLLGISPKAIGLGGELGFAIGARGLGAKSGQAHYEPTYNVINLTKKSGAGALAHEWWHALDFFMNREGNTRKASATSVENAEGFSKETRKEMRDAFMHLMETIKGSEYYKRTKALEHRMHPDRASNQTGYFDQPTELGARAFQDYVQRRLMEKGVKNDFLSTFTPEESWNGEAENYPYPTGKDAEKIAEAIDNVFSTIQERTDEDGKAILYHKAEGTAEGVSERDAMLRDAVVDKLREAGIEVVTDTEEAQRILDLANGEVRLMGEDSERRKERNRINGVIDEAFAFVSGRSLKGARDYRLAREAARRKQTKKIYDIILSGEYNDVSLQEINNYINDVTPYNPYGRRLSERLPQGVERKMYERERSCAIDALYSRASESTVSANERTRPEGKRRIEETKKELLKKWAQASGNWYTNLSELVGDTTPISNDTTDSDVYFDKDGAHVIKLSRGKSGKRFSPDIDNIPLFNYVFQNSAYKLLGYGDFGKGFVRILQQPYVDFNTSIPLKANERAEYMEKLGFSPINKENTAFSNGFIIVADLQGNNIVRDAEGNVRVIDADCKLHTKDVGGKYSYLPVEHDTYDADIREHRVYHGTGADFDAFDHSHMGEGEGAQAYGWGTYVTEVEGIGRGYAKRIGDMKVSERKFIEGKIEEARKYNIPAQVEYWENELEKKSLGDAQHYLYEVEIPEDDGSNYIDYFAKMQDQQGILDKIDNYMTNNEVYGFKWKRQNPDQRVQFRAGSRLITLTPNQSGADLYEEFKDAFGAKAASEILHAMGITGIKVPVNAMRGGREDGAKNFVIFDENNAKITDKVRFFRTESGEAYGFVKDGKIYLDPRIAGAQTAVHEYTHLWAEAVRKGNPEKWDEIKGVLLNDESVKPFIDEVRKKYPELTNEDELLDEVLAHYSGKRGAERLRVSTKRIADSKNGVFEKADVYRAMENLKNAIRRFWEAFADFMHVPYKSVDEIADRVMYDLLSGVNPRQEVEKLQKEPHKKKQLDIVTKANVMFDDYHTGIRTIDDIKTFAEAVEYGEGMDMYPDFTEDDAREALKSGEITVYSSKPIENGVFVSASRMEAEDYAGGGKVYEKRVPLTDVAWLFANEGQYAEVNEDIRFRDGEIGNNYTKRATEEDAANTLYSARELVKARQRINSIGNIGKAGTKAFESEDGKRIYNPTVAKNIGEYMVNALQEYKDWLEFYAEDSNATKAYKQRFADHIAEVDKAIEFYNELKDGKITDPNAIYDRDIRYREIGAPLNPRGERMTAQNTSLDEAIAIQGSGIRYSTRVNHNSPTLIKRADGSFVDPETGETLGFDHRFMGTGEGNQAHGWGSYFSANDIRAYANNVQGNETYKGLHRRDIEKEFFGDRAKITAVKEVLFAMREGKTPQEAIKEELDFWRSNGKPEEDDFAKSVMNVLEALDPSDFKQTEPERHHYDVEIPDNNGENYIEEKEPLSEKAIDRIVDALDKRLRNTFKDTRTEGFYEWARAHHSEGLRQGQHFRDIREFLRDSAFTEEEISNILHDAGFVGIHYYGRRDGDSYVIFDENDAKIVNHERFRDGEAAQTEERDEDAMERDARAFAEELGTKVRVVRDVNEIEHPDAATQSRMRESLGWFDPKSGEVVVVIPNNASALDVRATVLHEIVGHKGLQQVVGKEKFEDFLMKVYRGVDVETRKKINELAARNHWDFYEGIEEYIAQQAERGFEDRENAGLWRKIVQYVRDLLSEAKVRLGMNLGENDVRYMLWKTYQLKKGRRGVFAEAKDVALQNELGVGNYGRKLRPDDANERFNAELQQQIDGTLPKGHIYKLGMPSDALLSAGIENLPIEMAASTLDLKSSSDYKSNHPFELHRIMNLPKAIQHPIAIFNSERESGRKVILTELVDRSGNNFVGVVDVRNSRGRNVVSFNSIISLYPKESSQRIAKWFDSEMSGLTKKGEEPLLKWADTKKASDWLANHTSDVHAVGLSNRRIANKIKSFENPKQNGGNLRLRTSEELDRDYPNWNDTQTTSKGGHSTQITGTVSTYRKIGEMLKQNGMDGVSVLDASSGKGVGTEALRDMGFDVDDVEPYAPSDRKNAPTYDSYDKIDKKYDVIISNAVLNVIPDDWRADVLRNMAAHLADGGMMIVNTRGVDEAKGVKNKVELDDASEILISNGKGGFRSYQKFYNHETLAKFIKDTLGDGYVIEKATKANAGFANSNAVVVRKADTTNGGGIRFRDNGSNAAAHPDEADNTLRGVALEYNKRLGESGYQVKEAVQDSMRSLLEVQRILEERSGKPLEDWENAYMAENAMSSRNNAEYEAWKRDNYKPLTEAVRALMESEGLSREGVEEYLYMKHGIERNREMSVRAAIEEKAEREGKKAAHAEIRAQRDAAKQNGTDFKEPTDTERKRLEKQKEAEMQKQLRNDWKQKRDEIRKQYPNDWEKAQRELDKAATQTRKPIFFVTKVVA